MPRRRAFVSSRARLPGGTCHGLFRQDAADIGVQGRIDLFRMARRGRCNHDEIPRFR